MSAAEVRAFGREVLRRRTASGLTQEDLAKRAKLTSMFIGRVENGRMRRGISLDTAYKLARGLDASLADMIGGSQGLDPVGLEVGRAVEALPRPIRKHVAALVRALAKEDAR